MKVNIVNLDKDGWILTKFARRLSTQLKIMGHKCHLSKKAKNNVDVNHFIIFLFLKDKPSLFPEKTINTTMLTHVNDNFRYNKVKSISKYLDAGISMSKHHMDFIRKKKLGLKNLFYVLPPHDGDTNIKKIHIGIFSNIYNDGRKNESFFEKIFCKLDSDLFKISIIGKGWQKVIYKLKKQKIEVNYYQFFFRAIYLHELQKIDYLIYLGNDEGSMTFMDAIQLGIKTIMIPQGFQHDLKDLITHPLKKDLSNLELILRKIVSKKKLFIKYKKDLTWNNYAKEHLKIWEKLLKRN